MISPIDDISNL